MLHVQYNCGCQEKTFKGKTKTRQDVMMQGGSSHRYICIYLWKKKTTDKKVRSREVDGKEKLGGKKGVSQRMCAGYSSNLQTCPSGLPGV